MIVGNEIWLEFSGGIHSSLHPSKIDENELADGENFIARDGIAQLDQRYILAGQVGDPDGVCTGSGYGKFEDCEQYVAVVDNALYQIDLTESVLAFEAVTNAGALASGDWMFEQFESYIYMVSETAGIARKTICNGSNGTGDWSALKRPAKPTAAPFTPSSQGGGDRSFTPVVYTGGTITDSGSGVSAVVNAAGNIVITTTAAGDYWVMLTLDTSPDNRFDASYRDIWNCSLVKSNAGISTPKIALLEGATEIDTTFWGQEGSATSLTPIPYYRLQGIPRTSRDQVTALKFYFTAPAGTNTLTITPIFMWKVWMSLPSSYSPPDWPASPVFQPLKFAYTHYNATTGFESEPSPTLTIPASFQVKTGQWMVLLFAGSAESGVTHQRVYRVTGDAGSEAYYRIAEVANGTGTWTDKLSLDEILVLDILLPGLLENDGITAIASWQGRLALGVGNLVEISRSDDELSFPPLSGNVDENDIGNGLTFFCDDRKSEKVLGLAAADALTVITDRSVRALFGTVPQNWRYVKLNCQEGAVGKRAWDRFGEGVILLTPSGRLLYVALGQSEPLDIGAKVRDRIGSQGLKALATSDAIVAVRPDGQIEVRNQTGAYYVFDQGSARKGTHTHPTHSALFVSGLPIRWLGTDGKLYEGGDDAFVTDGGLLGDDGTEVEFWIETRDYTLPRMAVEDIYIRSGEHFRNPNNEMLSPRVLVKTARRNKEYTKTKEHSTIKTSVKDSGERLQLRLTGDRFTPIVDVRVRIKPLSKSPQAQDSPAVNFE